MFLQGGSYLQYGIDSS